MKRYLSLLLVVVGAGCPCLDCKRPREGIKVEAEVVRHLLAPAAKPLSLKVPQTNAVTTLKDVWQAPHGPCLKAGYSDGPERGTVVLDTQKITPISKVNTNSSKSKVHYTAPLIVSNQGSGVFHYIGLFVYDRRTKSSTHLDSYFLGDRIKGLEITDMMGAVKVDFFGHAPSQSFAEPPALPQSINLLVDKDFKFQRYEGMHPSWDADNDGVNDCEKDNSCDHTRDYTKARNQ